MVLQQNSFTGIEIKKKCYFYIILKIRIVRFRSGLIIALIFAITGFSCKQRGSRYIDQGEIHYTIEYMGNIGMVPKEYMPRNLIVSFKDNKILFDISAPFGNIGIYNLSNPKKEIFDTYISLLTLKYYYASKPGEINPGFESMKDLEIKKTSRSSVICGFNCKNAEVIFPGDRNKVYNIWYTNEINVKNPNVSTPFHEIDGVLMSFFFFMGTAEMRFNAETVYKKEIPDKTFERRDKYVRVSREEINSFINKMGSL